jgi:L-lactate dehydrogenase complex protein LldG
MQALGWVFGSERRLGPAQRAARLAPLVGLLPAALSPLRAWTSVRDLPPIPPEPFRAWWQRERGTTTPPPPLPPGPSTAEVGTSGTWAGGPGTGEAGTSGTAAGEIAGDPGPDDRGTADDGSSPGGAAGGGPARAAVLGRIRAALGTARGRPVEVPRGYRRGLYAAGTPAVVFAERVEDYRATVTRVPPDGVRAAVEAALAARGVRRIAIAPGLDPAWRPADPAVELLDDDPPLTVAALDGLDGALTGCAVGIAETGTIVLDGSPACGRRALTLVPDYHLCVVRVDQVVGGVPEAIAALDPARPLTFVSGPSATSDIELERVEGVHGPRTLAVLLVE